MINTTEARTDSPTDSPTDAPTKRLQLALNVDDLDAAVAFYSKMFGTEPAKIKPGYANFAIANPPLKLVLFEGEETGTLNHLGVEATTSAEVIEAEQRLITSGLETTGIDDTVCCYAEKTETWLAGPDGTRWEWYVVTGDTDTAEFSSRTQGTEAGGVCCAPDPASEADDDSTSSCC